MADLPLDASMMKRIGELKADLAKMTAWGRSLEHDKRLLQEENARLKAECQARQAENSVLAVECDSLKAEVERLTSDIQMEKENEDRLVREWQKANNEVYGLKTQVAALIDDQTRLKAEVERLKGIILAQSSDFVRNATKQNEEPLPDGWNSSVAKACDLLAEKDKDYARLKAEVERLTKAGDAMADRLIYQGYPETVPAWSAAKKGEQA